MAIHYMDVPLGTPGITPAPFRYETALEAPGGGGPWERRAGGDSLHGLLLRTLLSSAPIGIAFYDRELRCVRINAALAEIDGRSPEAYVGRTLDHGIPGLRDAARDALRRILDTGEPMVAVEVSGRTPARPDEERTWLATYYPVRDGRRGDDVIALGVVVVDITERKRAEAERERLVSDLRSAAAGQRRLMREMLYSITEGRLRLCDSESDLPSPLPEATACIPLSVASLRHLRQDVRAAAARLGQPAPRQLDLETATGEASMNAVAHAQGGCGWVCSRGGTHAGEESGDSSCDSSDSGAASLQVWVRDRGPGIPEAVLHRAILERGYTTTGTMGQGFWVMLHTADRTYLHTSPVGTTVVLEHFRTPPAPLWFAGA